MQPKEHWEKVYQEKDPTTDVSWFQAHPSTSLDLIQACGVAKSQPVVDIGGGASMLVDCLLDAGFEDVSVLDISTAALKHSQARLGARAAEVNWLVANITEFAPSRQFQLWHDRAVFHFLTAAEDRRGYLRALRKALPPGGHLILGTFALEGPPKCSGLPVARYDAPSICAELGPEFRLVEDRPETHVTPWSTEQKFNWFRFQRNTLTTPFS